MSNEEITEIIKEAEWQQQSFHRVSGKLSKRMIEALKQVHKYDIIGVVSKCYVCGVDNSKISTGDGDMCGGCWDHKYK